MRGVKAKYFSASQKPSSKKKKSTGVTQKGHPYGLPLYLSSHVNETIWRCKAFLLISVDVVHIVGTQKNVGKMSYMIALGK